MARFRDTLPVCRALGFKKFIKLIIKDVKDDQLTTQAAAVAYAWLFAVFPFLLFLITLFAYVPDKQRLDVNKVITSSVQKVMAKDAADTILINLKQVLDQPRSGLLSIGLAVTLWVASGGMAMTMSALDAAYDAKKTYPFYVQRPLAMLLTIIVIVLILFVMFLLPVGTAIESWLASTQHVPGKILWALTFVRYGVAILLMLAILAILYTFGTRDSHKFSFVTPGAVFTILVWVVLGECFNFYVNRFGRYQKTYGAVGGVTIILLFFYLDALVLLIGAEINALVNQTVTDRAAKEKATNNEIVNNETCE
jgi:membrane protein